MRAYPDHDAATAGAKRLAEVMSYKAALAGLPLGGGKSVINVDPRSTDPTALLKAPAQRIAELGGRYIPGVDMGTTVEDLDLVGTVVVTVSSHTRNPSGYTARGVVASVRAAVAETEDRDLSGVRVGGQGLGQVGAQIVHLLDFLANAGGLIVYAA